MNGKRRIGSTIVELDILHSFNDDATLYKTLPKFEGNSNTRKFEYHNGVLIKNVKNDIVVPNHQLDSHKRIPLLCSTYTTATSPRQAFMAKGMLPWSSLPSQL